MRKLIEKKHCLCGAMLVHVHVSGKEFWRCERTPDMCGAIGKTYKEALQTRKFMSKFAAPSRR